VQLDIFLDAQHFLETEDEWAMAIVPVILTYSIDEEYQSFRSMLQLAPHKPRLTRASLSFYSSIVEELISALCVVSRRLACMNFRFLSSPLEAHF
jgi:hypothetical protein